MLFTILGIRSVGVASLTLSLPCKISLLNCLVGLLTQCCKTHSHVLHTRHEHCAILRCDPEFNACHSGTTRHLLVSERVPLSWRYIEGLQNPANRGKSSRRTGGESNVISSSDYHNFHLHIDECYLPLMSRAQGSNCFSR